MKGVYKKLDLLCWDYDIDGEDVYKILKTRDDSGYPTHFKTLVEKTLRYLNFEDMESIFSREELKLIYRDINLKRVSHKQNKVKLIELLSE